MITMYVCKADFYGATLMIYIYNGLLGFWLPSFHFEKGIFNVIPFYVELSLEA